MLIPAPPAPAAPPQSLLGILHSASRRLERSGNRVRWDLTDCCGMPDVRLLVEHGSAVSVEVLVPGPEDSWWDAVRVKPASRLVWRGPERDCPADHLAWFVEDLLAMDVEQLPGRYRLLG